VKVLGLTWLGTRTPRFDEMVAFAEDVLGLERAFGEKGLAGFRLEDGSLFEIFAPGHPGGGHPKSGVVGGFVVDDVATACVELDAAGLEVSPLETAGSGAWAYFRAPDGNLYEIVGRA
jgi:catechol 2,3-dioxygenase-like lactoylglutathione lyase family enzyme